MKIRRKGVEVRAKPIKTKDVLQIPKEEVGFKVEELVRQEDVALLKHLVQELIGAGRLYNAALILSGLAIAYGKLPDGFDTQLDSFGSYITAQGFGADEVLVNVVVAFPEEREKLSNQVTAYWRKTTQGKLPVTVGPKDMVALSILAPRRQADLRINPDALQADEKAILEDIAMPKNILALSRLLIDVLLVNPQFKLQIPNLESVIQSFRQEIILLRGLRTDEAWKNISPLLKVVALLSADQAGIDSAGKVYTRFHTSNNFTSQQLPERPET